MIRTSSHELYLNHTSVYSFISVTISTKTHVVQLGVTISSSLVCPHSLQLERKGVYPGRTHRWGFHTIHRRDGGQEKHSSPASLRAPKNVFRWWSSHDVPWLWRAWSWNCELLFWSFTFLNIWYWNMLFWIIVQDLDFSFWCHLKEIIWKTREMYFKELIFCCLFFSATRPPLLPQDHSVHHPLFSVCKSQATRPPGVIPPRTSAIGIFSK